MTDDFQRGAMLCADDDGSIQSIDYRAALYRASSLSGLSDSEDGSEKDANAGRKERGRSAGKAKVSLKQEIQTGSRRPRRESQDPLGQRRRDASKSRRCNGSQERVTRRQKLSRSSSALEYYSSANESEDGGEGSRNRTRASIKNSAHKRASRRTRTSSFLGGSDPATLSESELSEQANDEKGRSQSLSSNPRSQPRRAESIEASSKRTKLSRSLSMENNVWDRPVDGRGEQRISRAASLRASKRSCRSAASSNKQPASCKRLSRSLSVEGKPVENQSGEQVSERRKQRGRSLRGSKAGTDCAYKKRQGILGSSGQRLARSMSTENTTIDRSLRVSRTRRAESVQGRKGDVRVRASCASQLDRRLDTAVASEHVDAGAEGVPGVKGERRSSLEQEPSNRKARCPKQRALPRRKPSDSQSREDGRRSSSAARKTGNNSSRALGRASSEKRISQGRSPPRRTLSDMVSRAKKSQQREGSDMSDASSHSSHSSSSRRRRKKAGRRPSQRRAARASDSESTDDESRRRLPRRTYSAQEKKNDTIAKENALLDQVVPSSLPSRTRNFPRRSYKDRCRTQIVSLSERLTADFEDTESEDEEDILSFTDFTAATASKTKEIDHETEQPQPATVSSLLARGRLAATLATTASTLASSASTVAANSLTMASSAASATAQTTFNLASTAGNTTMNLATTAMTSGFGVRLDAMKDTVPGASGRNAGDTPGGTPPVSLSVLPTAA